MRGAGAGGLVGREDELERVIEFVHATVGTTMLICGEPGIGKTALWRAGVEEANRRGLRVLEARPAAAERELSFAGLVDLLVDLHDEIGALPAPQRRALRAALLLDEPEGAAPEQRTIAVAFTELLRRASRDIALVVAVDDIQWLDAPSAAALEYAVRRLADAPVCLLGTARSDEELPIAFPEQQRLIVGPLSADELGRLVRARLGLRLLRPVIRELAEGTGGNPFYALELAEGLLRSGKRLEPGERLPVPAHLREITASRLEALSPAAREATLAAAALAQPRAVDVALVAGGDAAVAEAVVAGVLERRGDTLRFAHPLFAASVYEDASEAARKGMHERLAAIVVDPEERARQLAEAADGPDATISTFVDAAAARVASRGAPHAAVRLAKLAVELTPSGRRHALHRRRLECARYSFAAGDPEHARELLEQQLAESAPGRERAEVDLELGRAVFATDGTSAAMACYERGFREVDGSDELELQAQLLAELAAMHVGDLRADSDASARAVALAEKVWNPELFARALGVHAATLELQGQPITEEYWRRALAVERDTGQLRWAGPVFARGLVCMYELDYGKATALLNEVADSMRRRDDPMLHAALLLLGDIARNSGKWNDADTYIREAHDVVMQTGRQSIEPECLVSKARMAMLRGAIDLARRLANETRAAYDRLASSGMTRAALDGAMIEGLVLSVLARSAAMVGEHAEAHELCVRQREAWRSFPLREWVVELLADDVLSLVAMGRLDEAGRALDELREVQRSLPQEWLPGEAVSGRAAGVLTAARGDANVAIELLEEARETIEKLPAAWPYELGRTLLALGQVQRRARRKARARATLERALAIFEELGSKLWAAQARAELAQISGRPARSGALTPTEARVASVIAAGRSNAEAAHELFMSPKTVEWNLSKIYRKLHVRSRAELAAKLARQAAAPHS